MSTPTSTGSGPPRTSAGTNGPSVYFDGHSSRRCAVTLVFGDRLEMQSPETVTEWNYADIRRVDAPSGTLRLSCLTAPSLARLEVRDATLAAELVPRCAQLDNNVPGRLGVAAIIGMSLVVTASLVYIHMCGVLVA